LRAIIINHPDLRVIDSFINLFARGSLGKKSSWSYFYIFDLIIICGVDGLPAGRQGIVSLRLITRRVTLASMWSWRELHSRPNLFFENILQA
jgi:hypothetical protein